LFESFNSEAVLVFSSVVIRRMGALEKVWPVPCADPFLRMCAHCAAERWAGGHVKVRGPWASDSLKSTSAPVRSGLEVLIAEFCWTSAVLRFAAGGTLEKVWQVSQADPPFRMYICWVLQGVGRRVMSGPGNRRTIESASTPVWSWLES